MPAYRLTSKYPLKRLFLVLAFAGLALSCAASYAVTLGEEQVLSALGDPIEVEIDVLQWDDIDFDRVQIAVASAAEYKTFNLSYLPVLQDLKFNLIGPNSAGQVKVLISTRKPVVEPYLELLLVMRWPGGSLLREYVLLFDLPETSRPALSASSMTADEISPPTAPAAVTGTAQEEPGFTVLTAADLASARLQAELVAGENSAPVQAESEPVPAAEVRLPTQEIELPGVEDQQAPAVEAQASVALVPAATVTEQRVYQVKEGDILWNLALQFLPAGATVNIYQMLLGIHDLNGEAFINGNISLLKADALLQIPALADISKIDALSAESKFEQLWNEATQRIDLARSGQALPESSPLYEAAESSTDAAPTTDKPTSREETGSYAAQGNGLILPSTTTVVVPLTVEAAKVGDVLVSAPTAVTDPNSTNNQAKVLVSITEAAATGDSYNPNLERINESARKLQTLLETRSMQIARLEQQVADMRIRMREAQEVAASVSKSVEQFLSARTQREQVYARNTTLLGSLALVLLLALVLASAMVLKLTGVLRSQRKLLGTDEVLQSDLDTSWIQNSAMDPAAAHQHRTTPVSTTGSGIEVTEALPQELLDIIASQVQEAEAGSEKT